MCIKYTGGLSLRPVLTFSPIYVCGWHATAGSYMVSDMCMAETMTTAAPFFKIYPEDGGCIFGWPIMRCCSPNWWVLCAVRYWYPAVYSPATNSFRLKCKESRRHVLRPGYPKSDPRAKCGPPVAGRTSPEIVQQVFATFVAGKQSAGPASKVWLSAESCDWIAICIATEGGAAIAQSV